MAMFFAPRTQKILKNKPDARARKGCATWHR